MIEAQLTVINEQWQDAADATTLAELERAQLWHRQILNPFITHGWPV